MIEPQLVPEISSRESLTHWSEQKISEDAWGVLLEAARRAPSSWNHQPARYVVITDSSAVRQTAQALHRANGWAEKASALIVQAAAPEDDDQVDGKPYYLYDCGLAMMSLIYQAQSMGMTSRQMIGWDERELKSLLHIPERYRIVVVTALGYPSESLLQQKTAQWKRTLTGQNKRHDIRHLAFWQQWGVSK